MEYITRTIERKIIETARSFHILTLTGPRQSGKSTLAKRLFKHLPYVNLESLAVRARAQADPVSFLAQYQAGAVIDEAQNVPELFSELQVMVDGGLPGAKFVLLGSQNFLLLEKVTQSLAGRTAVLHLLPFGIEEYLPADQTLEDRLFRGSYPSIYDQSFDASQWLDNYVRTYIERDVRSLSQILDLAQFQLFMRMCAARSGQILDLTAIAQDTGVQQNTVKRWFGFLESSFICFRSQPYYRNYGKRLVKRPKLYFWDSGLLCYLLGIRRAEDLLVHERRGAIFESFIVAELMKARIHRGESRQAFFFQDRQHEVDFIAERTAHQVHAFEIKSSRLFHSDFLDGMKHWSKTSGSMNKNFLIYGGDESQPLGEQVQLLSWRDTPRWDTYT